MITVLGRNLSLIFNPILRAVTGNGRAAKSQVQGMVKTLLSLNKLPEPADISDALAMAISYVYIEGVK